jgi:hypothetical protein
MNYLKTLLAGYWVRFVVFYNGLTEEQKDRGRKITFKVLPLVIFVGVLLSIYGMASLGTRGGAIYEHVNKPSKVQERIQKEALKEYERNVAARDFRIKYYPKFLVALQNQSHPVGDRP